ncbi:MAG: hypothetical protein FH751_05655 [Firmicutes bacterium]|nr:hypothetical protein [Bacillota bacterium]
MKSINKKVLFIILVIIVVGFFGYNYLYTSYNEYNSLIKTLDENFKPQGFININEKRNNKYSKITSYPSKDWGGNNNNAHNGNGITPKQIDFYYTINNNKQIISKITFVYSPYCLRRKYKLVDYFEELKGKSVIEEYKGDLVTPYYQVAFQGKGYTVFVTSLYTEKFYKSEAMTKDKVDIALSQNAKLVRELQKFLMD